MSSTTTRPEGRGEELGLSLDFRVQSTGFRVLGFGFRVLGFRIWHQGLEFEGKGYGLGLGSGGVKS